MVRLRRDPAGRNSTSSRRYLLWMIACLLVGRLANAQVYPTGNGPAYTPNAVFNGPPQFNGPTPAFGPQGAGPDGLLPANGNQEPGALQNVQYTQTLGDLGTVNVYGSPDPENYGIGAGFNSRNWLYFRDLQAAVYTNQEQTVVNAGTTMTLLSNDRYALAGRALFGATVDDNLQDELHFSGDAYAGIRLPGEIWLKGGYFYDTQDSFYKHGPAVGAVLLADAKHPITVDFAYAMGGGNIRANQAKTGILGVADDDVQIRVGTYLSPMMQLGVSANWADWDNPIFKDDSGVGGFARMSIADLDIIVDVTNGDLGTRGFVNVAYVFGGPQRKSWRDRYASPFVDQPEDWMTRPVIRDTSLRVQQVVTSGGSGGGGGNGGGGGGTTPIVGNLTGVLCSIQVNPAFDQVNPGVLDPGDGFNLLVTLVNRSSQTATGVSITNLAADQGFVIFNTPSTEVINAPDIPAGGSVTLSIPSTSLGIDNSTPQFSSFNLSYDVTSDGASRRFQCGPITLGVTGNSTPATNATPISP